MPSLTALSWRWMALVVCLLFAVKLPAATSERVIYNFGLGALNGLNPRSPVVFDRAGNLYGTTTLGGAASRGVVYELSPSSSGWTEKTLYSFSVFYPNDAGLTFDSSGNLYGVATEGGLYNKGAIFELVENSDGSWTEKNLHNFGAGADGAYPEGTLILDSAGNLYGTSYYGGNSNLGCVFELSQDADGSWKERVLYSFRGGNDGAYPLAAVTFDSAGNLYGTTYQGGVSQVGVVFELETSGSGWNETVLYSFQGGADGSRPMSNLIFDSAGNLYGTTEEGGASDLGTVFQLSRSGGSWLETDIHSFSGSDGEYPVTGLVFSGGVFYGTTPAGQNSSGTVYALTQGSEGEWNETVLYMFTGEFGEGGDASGLVFGNTGSLFCAEAFGGRYGDGAVFELTP